MIPDGPHGRSWSKSWLTLSKGTSGFKLAHRMQPGIRNFGKDLETLIRGLFGMAGQSPAPLDVGSTEHCAAVLANPPPPAFGTLSSVTRPREWLISSFFERNPGAEPRRSTARICGHRCGPATFHQTFPERDNHFGTGCTNRRSIWQAIRTGAVPQLTAVNIRHAGGAGLPIARRCRPKHFAPKQSDITSTVLPKPISEAKGRVPKTAGDCRAALRFVLCR
jgi:hypothetical protein